ncbi:hypothetical protein D3C86_2012620 [compost metagenome]
MTLQQVGQWLDQLCLQALAEPRQWQHAAALQATSLSTQCLAGVLGARQGSD